MRATAKGMAGFLLAVPCIAQAAGGPEVSPWGYLGSSAVVLLFLVGLLLAANWLLRRYGKAPGARAGRLRVVDSVSLGPHERLVLVAMDNNELLLGVGQGRVTAITAPQSSGQQARRPGSLAQVG